MRLPLVLILCASALYGHAQFGKKMRLLLNGDPAAAPNYDTSYIASYRSNLTLSLLATYQSVDVDFEQDQGDDLSFSANTAEQYGLGLNFKWLSVDATFTVPTLDDYDPAFGKSRSRSFGLGYTGRRLWARGFWNNTKGYYLNDPVRWSEGWQQGDKQITRGDLTSDSYMLSVNYALSGKKRFSENAALFQMERQKKSAGTFVLGFSGWRSVISADSSILSPALQDTFQLAAGFKSFGRTIAAATIGYAHTFSFWHKGFIHAAIQPGLGYVHQTISTTGPVEVELEGNGVGAVVEMKLGVGYNGDRWYTALTWAYYQSSTPLGEKLNLSTNYSFGRFAIGMRFGDPGIKGLEKVGL